MNFMMSETEPKREQEKKIGVAFVFSNELDENGEINAETKARVDKAIELFEEGKIQHFLLTGGIFRSGMKQPISEIMKEYLLSRSIPDDSIIIEKNSKDTATNILFGYLDILKKFGPEKFRTEEKIYATEEEIKEAFKSIMNECNLYWVSSKYHLERVIKLLEGNGLYDSREKFVAPDSHSKPDGWKNKLIEQVARVLLLLEKDGRGPITSYLRNKDRND